MNVLVLTPDRVGSTLLQRLLTVYMAAHEFDKPVINLHELTNGLHLYYSDVFNKEVLGKPQLKNDWGYHQSLKEIVDLLDQADHYKTSRLAHYHIKNRQDNISDQVSFYKYLNDNFFIISARRSNLFEHAISWGITLSSKKLNVFTHNEKVDTFYDIYKNGITIDPITIEKYLTDYKNYLKWCDDHFRVNSYFNYEKDLKDLESYILNLDVFTNKTKRTWNDIFSIGWNDWNKCHKLISDIGSVDTRLLVDNSSRPSDNIEEMNVMLQTNLSTIDQQYLLANEKNYTAVYQGIQQLVTQGVLITGIPIKLQTLAEKRKIIKNFNQCIEVYNKWVEENQLGEQYSDTDIKLIANDESVRWYNEVPKNLLLK